MSKNILMRKSDNVATCLEDLEAGDVVEVTKEEFCKKVEIAEMVPFGHKFAITDILQGSKILKYGEPIGEATKDIQEGAHVHVHNADSIRGRSVDGGENI